MKIARFSRRSLSACAAVLAGAAALTGAAVVTATSAPASQQPAASSNPTITWQDCGSDAATHVTQCGTISVPLDWADRSGQQITLAVTRHRATGTKRGTLLFTPHAGYTANDILVTNAAFYFNLLGAPELVDQFDIIGIEPRGGAGSLYGRPIDLPVRTSPQLDCPTPAHDQQVSLFPDSRAEYDRLVAHNRAFAQDCLDHTGPLVRHMDSLSQARDIEAIRAALGEPKLDWMAWTYSTVVAQTYAQLYPGRIRALVLDGPFDRRVPKVVQAFQEARAVEKGFKRFAQWCEEAGPVDAYGVKGCALYGQPVQQVFEQMLAYAASQPLPAPLLGEGRTLNREEIAFLTLARLELGEIVLGQITTSYTQLSLSIAEAAQQHTANGYAWMVGRGAETLVNRLTPCLDFSDRVTSYPQLRRQLALVRAAAPVTGGVSEAWRATATCAGWPFPAASRVPSRIVDGPRVLVLTSRYNAFSPPGHATLVARQFRHSTVVRTDKAMHASFFDPAVAKRTVAFLVDSTG